MLSKDKFIELCNGYQSGLDFSKLMITDPLPIQVNENNHNTLVTIKATPLITGLTGSKAITYTRLELQRIFKGLNLTLDCTKYNTFEKAVKYISDLYQLDIDPIDYIESTPSVEEGFVLVPKSTNYQYIGNLQFKHSIQLKDIPFGEIDGFKYPTAVETNKLNANLYSLTLDYTPSLYLSSVEKGSVPELGVVTRLLKLATGLPWELGFGVKDYNTNNIVIKDVVRETTENGILSKVTFSLANELNGMITGDITLKSLSLNEIDKSATKRFTEYSEFLIGLEVNDTLSTEAVNKINEMLFNKGIDKVIDETYEVTYNGSTENLGDDEVFLLTQDTPRICTLNNDLDYVVLHY